MIFTEILLVVILFIISIALLIRNNKEEGKMKNNSNGLFFNYLGTLMTFNVISIIVFEIGKINITYTNGSNDFGTMTMPIPKLSEIFVSISFILYIICFVIIWTFLKKKLKNMLNCSKPYFYLSIFFYLLFSILQAIIFLYVIIGKNRISMPNEFLDQLCIVVILLPLFCFIFDSTINFIKYYINKNKVQENEKN